MAIATPESYAEMLKKAKEGGYASPPSTAPLLRQSTLFSKALPTPNPTALFSSVQAAQSSALASTSRAWKLVP